MALSASLGRSRVITATPFGMTFPLTKSSLPPAMIANPRTDGNDLEEVKREKVQVRLRKGREDDEIDRVRSRVEAPTITLCISFFSSQKRSD